MQQRQKTLTPARSGRTGRGSRSWTIDIRALPRAQSLTLRRFTSILLLLGFVTLATGLLENLHLQSHLRDQQRGNLAQEDSHHSEPSDSDCPLCLQLHLPTISAGWVPLLICLGLFVAFLTLLAPRLTPQRAVARIDCRGPPCL